MRNSKGQFIKGRKPNHSKETKEKIRLAALKQHQEGRGSPRRKGQYKPTKETLEKISQARKLLNLKGEKSGVWKGGKPKCLGCNKQLTNYGLKRCNSCGQKNRWDKVGRKKYPRYIHLCKSPEYKKWRSDVFTRDNWTCQTCGIRGISLEAHHIKGWARFPKFRYDINNGVTLCRECHKLTDNYKGKALRK